MSRIITNNLRHNDASSDNLTLDGTGNITAPGNLSVTGTSTLSGNVSASGNLNVTGTSTLTDDLVVDTDTLFVDASADRVGVGTPDPRRHFHIHETTAATVGLMLTNSTTGNADDGQGFQLKVGADGHAEVAQLENSDLRFFTNNTERLRITSGGVLQLHNSAGIDFSQIQTNAAGMSSETLDSYEEGTWTPNIGGTATYNIQWGTYIKIGKQVTCWGGLRPNSLGTGNLRRIYGLPFTVHQQSTATLTGGGSIVWYDGSATSHVNTPALAPVYFTNHAEINIRTGATDTLQANFDFWTNQRRANFWITYQAA